LKTPELFGGKYDNMGRITQCCGLSSFPDVFIGMILDFFRVGLMVPLEGSSVF